MVIKGEYIFFKKNDTIAQKKFHSSKYILQQFWECMHSVTFGQNADKREYFKRNFSILYLASKSKVKVIPLQARCGPEGG